VVDSTLVCVRVAGVAALASVVDVREQPLESARTRRRGAGRVKPPPTSLLDDFVSWVTTSLCAAPRKTLQSLQVDVDEPEIPHAAM
jgi:hypothetical protein